MKEVGLFLLTAASCALAALVDFKTRRAPNYLTLLGLGLLASFPGDPSHLP